MPKESRRNRPKFSRESSVGSAERTPLVLCKVRASTHALRAVCVFREVTCMSPLPPCRRTPRLVPRARSSAPPASRLISADNCHAGLLAQISSEARAAGWCALVCGRRSRCDEYETRKYGRQWRERDKTGLQRGRVLSPV